MNRGLITVAVAALSLLGCTKKPTPAQLVAQSYAEEAAKAHSVSSFINDQPYKPGQVGGEPQAGSFEVCQEMAGLFDWTKSKPVRDDVLADGTHSVELLVDICMRADDNSVCNRPNTYSLQLLMHDEGGTWAIDGSTCGLHSGVR